MQEGTVTVPPTGIGKISWSDIGKGALTAALTTLFSGLYLLLEDGNLPGWVEFKPYIVASIASAVGYILKNVLTNNVGQLLTKDKNVVTVSKQHLEVLETKAESNTISPLLEPKKNT